MVKQFIDILFVYSQKNKKTFLTDCKFKNIVCAFFCLRCSKFIKQNDLVTMCQMLFGKIIVFVVDKITIFYIISSFNKERNNLKTVMIFDNVSRIIIREHKTKYLEV